MDTLTHYIQKGKKLTVLKLFSVFFLLTVLIVGVAGVRMNYALSQPDFKAFLTEIPLIEMKDGTVIKPADKVWEKKLADDQFLFQIDTTKEKIDNPPANGIILTRKNIIFTLNSQVKQYDLPQKEVTIDTPYLLNLFRMIVVNTCVLIGIILLLVLLLGQASTSVLTSFCLWLFKKPASEAQIRRSSFVGWLLVVFLNICLKMFGYGFSLIMCVFIATAISVFGLIWTDKEN